MKEAKNSVCCQTWDLVSKISDIQPRSELKHLVQCAADGSPTRSLVFEDLQELARPLTNDSELRTRIYERYLHFGGRRFEHEVPDMLPRSASSMLLGRCCFHTIIHLFVIILDSRGFQVVRATSDFIPSSADEDQFATDKTYQMKQVPESRPNNHRSIGPLYWYQGLELLVLLILRFIMEMA